MIQYIFDNRKKLKKKNFFLINLYSSIAWYRELQFFFFFSVMTYLYYVLTYLWVSNYEISLHVHTNCLLLVFELKQRPDTSTLWHSNGLKTFEVIEGEISKVSGRYTLFQQSIWATTAKGCLLVSLYVHLFKFTCEKYIYMLLSYLVRTYGCHLKEGCLSK